MAGTPPIDKGYDQRHPDWRESYHVMRRDLRDQFLRDREVGMRIDVGGGRMVPSSDLSADDIERIADERARRVLDQAVNRDVDVIAVGKGL